MPEADDSMTVAEVRKALSLMRRRWDCIVEHLRDAPPLTSELDLGSRKLAVEHFALRFILGQHSKRQTGGRGEDSECAPA